MIGNDIVDLKEARKKSNWQRPGFLQKVFSPSEQRLIHNSENPFHTVWRLWSMKESAYKIYLQKYTKAPRGFYPAKINCQVLSRFAGRVAINGWQLQTKTIFHPEYLFSVAFSTQNVSTETDIFYLNQKSPAFQSTFTKKKLLSFVAQTQQVKMVDLEIVKDRNKVPFIHHQTKKLPLACSLTHHGFYGAFTVAPIDN